MTTSNIQPSADAEHTIFELLAVYSRDYLSDLAPKSQYYYRWFIKYFGKYYGALTLPDVTTTMLRAFIQALRQDQSASTVRTYVALLSSILAAAVELEWLATNPLRMVRKPREPQGRVRFLSDDERTRLLAACHQNPHPALYVIVVLAISTGARKK